MASINKCVCGKKFAPGDMIHEVPAGDGNYQILCDMCYKFYGGTKL